MEYAALVCGARIAYTDRRRFKEDLAKYRPTFVPSVPRLWETVYDGVRQGDPGRLAREAAGSSTAPTTSPPRGRGAGIARGVTRCG